ncbi:unnamed protein product [Arctia plantaginis]|uniref:Complex 1 LYR protein domain-containing protein n=1 Tax=Arctia plantaginis TaxID=874455 RepID=A0A8S0ZS33_ARCPL|nr:unnamed protein product [Arctia plantaginis]CAB3262148.1 unnamed protein product [Arctia plantaginis]
MASSPSRRSILTLYKNLIRESEKFPNYNFRAYALRKVRDSFRTNQKLTDKKERITQYNLGVDNLDVIRRQIIVGNLYKSEKLVIENLRKN